MVSAASTPTPKLISPTSSNLTENVLGEARLTKRGHSFHFALDNVTNEIVDLRHLDFTLPILEQVEPLEKVLIAEESTTLSSPTSSDPLTQIVKVNTGEICPTLCNDMDLVRQVLAHEDENNATLTPLLT